MPVEFDLSGKVALVTGGTRGVGRGIAEAFLSAGADVVICARNEPAVLPRTTTRSGAAVGAHGGDGGGDDGGDGGSDAEPGAGADPGAVREATFLPVDVRDWDEIGQVIGQTVERFGRLDVVVNNAGGAPPASAATASPRFSAAIVNLNLLAPLLMTQRANEVMQDQAEGGSIINISSLNGMRPSPGTAAYGAAKAGLINLTTSLAVEFAPKVRVNCVTAGALATEELYQQYGGDAYFAKVAATVPLGRMGTPADVAQACLFLASDAALFVTGTNLVVHGGGDDPPPAEPDPT
jgi:NAD(P)-dependent dehydrogenase (short-subunit alcohol dehydrogenase family)